MALAVMLVPVASTPGVSMMEAELPVKLPSPEYVAVMFSDPTLTASTTQVAVVVLPLVETA